MTRFRHVIPFLMKRNTAKNWVGQAMSFFDVFLFFSKSVDVKEKRKKKRDPSILNDDLIIIIKSSISRRIGSFISP